jgi:AraC-like DNA-binding protein
MTEAPIVRDNAQNELAPADPLSAVLNQVKLRAEVICASEFSAPFGIAFPAGPSHFHAVESGSVWVTAAVRSTPLRVASGAFLLFPRGDGHILSDARDSAVTPLAEAIRRRSDADRAAHVLRAGGGGDVARLTCARFRYDNPLAERWLDALPRVIVIDPEPGPQGWLHLTSRALMGEVRSPHAGSAVMIARLLDLLFVQMLRQWSRLHTDEASWLTAASDPRIGRALAAIHEAPAHDWTIEELAARAGLARSSFSARFNTLVGKAPATYLADWRMNLAADMLRQSEASIGAISRSIGYDSDAGFSRAFKLKFGVSPKIYRQQAAADLKSSS